MSDFRLFAKHNSMADEQIRSYFVESATIPNAFNSTDTFRFRMATGATSTQDFKVFDAITYCRWGSLP